MDTAELGSLLKSLFIVGVFAHKSRAICAEKTPHRFWSALESFFQGQRESYEVLLGPHAGPPIIGTVSAESMVKLEMRREPLATSESSCAMTWATYASLLSHTINTSHQETAVSLPLQRSLVLKFMPNCVRNLVLLPKEMHRTLEAHCNDEDMTPA